MHPPAHLLSRLTASVQRLHGTWEISAAVRGSAQRRSSHLGHLAPKGWSPAAIREGLLLGDAAAGDALYDRMGKRVNGLVWRMLGPDPDHDDLVQQIFMNVIAGVGGLRDAAKLDAWVIGVAANTVRHELRRRKWAGWFSLRLRANRPAVTGEVPSERLLLPRAFYRALATLRTDDRLILCLRYLEEYTLPEVASLCGCSLATAKRRLSRAVKACRRVARRDPVLRSWLEEVRHE
jgi:RNA polymerase sigma-70 factor (ECF subfamily)